MKKVLKVLYFGVLKLYNWIVWSSVNPDKISLTLKALIPFLVFLNVGVSTENLGATADAIVKFLVLLGTWISGGVLMFAAGRKVIATIYNAPE